MELNLWNEATRCVQDSIEQLQKTVAILLQERPEMVYDQPPKKVGVSKLDPILRERIKKSVTACVRQTKWATHRDIYRAAYERLYQETGFNAQAYALIKGYPSYLEGVHRKGHLKKLAKIVERMAEGVSAE